MGKIILKQVNFPSAWPLMKPLDEWRRILMLTITPPWMCWKLTFLYVFCFREYCMSLSRRWSMMNLIILNMRYLFVMSDLSLLLVCSPELTFVTFWLWQISVAQMFFFCTSIVGNMTSPEVSWIVCLPPDQAVWIQTLWRDIVLCSWTWHLILSQCLSPSRCINGYSQI